MVGDKLLSSDKKTAVNVVDTDRFQKPCVKLTLDDGSSIVVTEDHRMPTQKNYIKGKWDMNIDNYMVAKDLHRGCFVPKMF